MQICYAYSDLLCTTLEGDSWRNSISLPVELGAKRFMELIAERYDRLPLQNACKVLKDIFDRRVSKQKTNLKTMKASLRQRDERMSSL